ncbi:hypothetical protein WH390_07290 [Candidatus Arsenophonus nilaparvatae]|uniref:hypothetical protein n=1 Tax=Candidatus Arsenophonus nilaparvatae TaxID=1247023 RepID=UPI000509D195|nr:hypothetical protein [Candidatus Arsenophonus nilaparvatae]
MKSLFKTIAIVSLLGFSYFSIAGTVEEEREKLYPGCTFKPGRYCCPSYDTNGKEIPYCMDIIENK